jgi:hypothetical protein
VLPALPPVPPLPEVAPPDEEPQTTCTSSRLAVAGQGSPNVALLAVTAHDAFPTHALDTNATELAALHEPSANDPHDPLGVP